MNVKETGLKDCFILEPNVHEDHRGYFFESYNHEKMQKQQLDYQWIQDNEAKSNKNVLRGLHFQKGNAAQAKLVRVITGAVQDVVVDLRQSSPTFGKSFGITLTGQNKLQLLVPRGFAHGYAVLEDNTIFAYKCDNIYKKESEGGLYFADPELHIEWLITEDEAILSEKDRILPIFKNAFYFE